MIGHRREARTLPLSLTIQTNTSRGYRLAKRDDLMLNRAQRRKLEAAKFAVFREDSVEL